MRKLIFGTVILGLVIWTPAARAQTPSHYYDLNNSLADGAGGPSLGSDGGSLSSSGYTFGANQGLTLSGVFSSGSSYSLAIQSYFTDVSGYRKIVDYNDLASDNGYYDNSSHAEFYPAAGGVAGAYAPSTLAFTVLTRDAATKLFSFYVNGTLQNSFLDTSNYSDFSATGGLARFFEDDTHTHGNESSAGFVNYIATYDRALTPAEVAALKPVVATVPEPASFVLVGTGLLAMAGVVRRRSAR